MGRITKQICSQNCEYGRGELKMEFRVGDKCRAKAGQGNVCGNYYRNGYIIITYIYEEGGLKYDIYDSDNEKRDECNCFRVDNIELVTGRRAGKGKKIQYKF
jgi:hypothetical protein